MRRREIEKIRNLIIGGAFVIFGSCIIIATVNSETARNVETTIEASNEIETTVEETVEETIVVAEEVESEVYIHKFMTHGVETIVNDGIDETVVEIESETEIETIVETESVVEETTEDSTYYGLTEGEIDLIALVTMAEAEGESDLGKRWVIDVILNRLDSPYFPNTVYDVIYEPGQFSSMWGSRVKKCYVSDHICQLVKEELQSRQNYNALYFRTKHYHKFGTPITKIGNHYFSGR